MQFDRFLDAYKTPTDLPEYSGQQKEVLDRSEKWMDYFARNLQDYLSGDLIPDKRKPCAQMLIEYSLWIDNSLRPMLKSSLYQARSERSSRLATRLNFHVLNFAFTEEWLHLLTDQPRDEVYTDTQADNIQRSLAVSAIELLKKRETIPVEDYYGKEAGMLRKTYEGILNEYDTAIVLAETIRRQPDLLVLPAPGGFEHGTNSFYNNDFLYVDQSQKEVIGIQAKTNVIQATQQRYDPDYVVLVDGTIDLGNVSTRKGRLKNASSTAGLIAAETILSLPTHGKDTFSANIATRRSEKEIMQAKFFARTIGYNSLEKKKAAKRVKPRILQALYHHATDEVEKTAIRDPFL